MKVIKFPKGIQKLIFPMIPEIEGESTKALRKFIREHKMPKKYEITFERKILIGYKNSYDLTQISIIK